MKTKSGNTILYRLIAIDEMQIHTDKNGKEKDTGTTAEVIGNTNQVQFTVVEINGKEYHIFNKTI